MSLLEKHTALEKTDDVKSVLEWKLNEIQENNLPISAFGDYIALGLQGCSNKVAQLKEYKKQLDIAIKESEQYEKDTSAKCAEFLLENGITKLECTLGGLSSITTTKAKKQEEKAKEKFVCELSSDEQKKFLVEAGKANFVYELETVLAKPSQIRINKKR